MNPEYIGNNYLTFSINANEPKYIRKITFDENLLNCQVDLIISGSILQTTWVNKNNDAIFWFSSKKTQPFPLYKNYKIIVKVHTKIKTIKLYVKCVKLKEEFKTFCKIYQTKIIENGIYKSSTPIWRIRTTNGIILEKYKCDDYEEIVKKYINGKIYEYTNKYNTVLVDTINYLKYHDKYIRLSFT